MTQPSSTTSFPDEQTIEQPYQEKLLELGYDLAYLKWFSFYRRTWRSRYLDFDPDEYFALLAAQAKEYPDDSQIQDEFVQYSFFETEPRCPFLCEPSWNPDVDELLAEGGFETEEDFEKLTPERWEELMGQWFKPAWEYAIEEPYIFPYDPNAPQHYDEIPF